MAETAHPAASPVEASTRFLVEFDKTWSLCRLYGTDHPAFLQSADAAAACLGRPIQVSVSPTGFSVGKTAIPEEGLRGLAQRLRKMNLVGLNVEPGLTPAQIVSLVHVLHESERERLSGDAVVNKISAATAQRVKAVPLRLAGLHLVSGMAVPPAPDKGGRAEDDDSAIWQSLFSDTLFGEPGESNSEELAKSFESALKGVQATSRWKSMMGVWIRELGALDPLGTASAALAAKANVAAGATQDGASQDGASPAGAEAGPYMVLPPSAGAPPGAAEPAPSAGAAGQGFAGSERFNAVAAFMGALSPNLCQRLLVETITGRATSDRVVLALAERLPAGVVLGALASVDRTGREPSSAALALLRKFSTHATGDKAADVTPRTNAELAEVSASLERLLSTKHEGGFVPEEYLERRQELSRGVLDAAAGAGAVVVPTEHETSRHAGELVFHILGSPESEVAHVKAALEFLRTRVGLWVRAGDYQLASRGMELARALWTHADDAVSEPAKALLATAITLDDLVEGARRCADRKQAVAGIGELLRHDEDGAFLAGLMSSSHVAGAEGDNIFLEAVRTTLPAASEGRMKSLFALARNKPPQVLLTALSSLPEGDAIKTLQGALAHAPPSVRYALVQVVFRRNFPWPMPLTDRLLKDDEPGIRRLAVMRLIRDGGLSGAASVLLKASNAGDYESDVALGLAELLQSHRQNADVRNALRRWFWSKRRWLALLSFSLGSGRRAG
jgi:hypothetical protein